jgi:hypothetical protein
MSRNYTNSEAKKRRRMISIAWGAGVTLMIIGLMIYQQTEILYVLSTVSVTVLLVLVAKADLHGKDSGTATVTEPALASGAQIPADVLGSTRRVSRPRKA